MISDDLNVICPWCGDDSTLKEWNDSSFEECLSRETRRSFVKLNEERVWKKESKNFYKCPCCNKWSRGNKLKIANANTNELKELGGEPLFEVVK